MNREEVLATLEEKFVCYTKISSMSDRQKASQVRPSTPEQRNMFIQLVKDLHTLGITDVEDGGFYVIAKIKGNVPSTDTIAFITHVDTASDCKANGVQTQTHPNYDGGDIVLKDGVTITPQANPDLLQYKGTTIFTSDGTTLLGGDDKSGVSAVMAALTQLVKHPELPHGDLEIVFTSDEETGFGMADFPFEKLQSTVCHTLDREGKNIIDAECFNASQATIKIHGIAHHTGTAKGYMVNALTLAGKFLTMLPGSEAPETTERKEGFYAPVSMEGNISLMTIDMILRDFKLDGLKRREAMIQEMAKSFEVINPGCRIEVSFEHQYYNLGDTLGKFPQSTANIVKACEKVGQPIKFSWIRGGTDGALLSEHTGKPCPNIYTGCYNFHSQYEWASLEAMYEATELVLAIMEVYTEK